MDELRDVIVHVGDSPSAGCDVFRNGLADGAHRGVLAAIDGHLFMHASEEAIALEKQIEAYPGNVATDVTAFQPDADVVVDITVIHDERGAELLIAQGVRRRVHE